MIVDLDLELHWLALLSDVAMGDLYPGNRLLLCACVDLDANTCHEREFVVCATARGSSIQNWHSTSIRITAGSLIAEILYVVAGIYEGDVES